MVGAGPAPRWVPSEEDHAASVEPSLERGPAHHSASALFPACNYSRGSAPVRYPSLPRTKKAVTRAFIYSTHWKVLDLWWSQAGSNADLLNAIQALSQLDMAKNVTLPLVLSIRIDDVESLPRLRHSSSRVVIVSSSP